MRKIAIAVVFAIFIAFTGYSVKAFGQVEKEAAKKTVAFIFDGARLVGTPFFIGDKKRINVREELSELKSGTFFPGVEARFAPDHRVSVGVGYQRWQLKGQKHESVKWGNDITKEVVRFDRARNALANALTGTVYINILTRSRVRPFIGMGAGIGIFNEEEKTFNIKYNQDVYRYYDPSMEIPTTRYIKYKEGILRGIVGLNIIPAENFVFTIGGGYFNGPAISLAAGVRF